MIGAKYLPTELREFQDYVDYRYDVTDFHDNMEKYRTSGSNVIISNEFLGLLNDSDPRREYVWNQFRRGLKGFRVKVVVTYRR